MIATKILLVMDDPGAEKLRTRIRSLGYQIVDSVSEGEQGIKKAAELLPDLVIINMHLSSGVSGIQAGSQIYEQYDIPIIYIADHSGEKTIRRSKGTAPFGYLFEDLGEKQILATIEVALTRHNMEKKIRESEQWLNAILFGIGEGVIAVDNEHRIRLINPIAEILTGRKSIDALNRPLEDVLSLVYSRSLERVNFTQALTLIRTHEARRGFKATLISKDNRQVPVEVFISPLSEKSILVGAVLVIKDISDRKHALEETQMHAKQAEAMLRAAEQLNARLDLKAGLSTVCEICNYTFGTTVTIVFLTDPSQNALISMAISVNQANKNDLAFDKQYVIPIDFIEKIVSESNLTVGIKDIQALDIPDIPYFDQIKENDIRSLAISGLYQNNALMGILVTATLGVVRDFTREELALLLGLADQASVAVGNAALLKQVIDSRERQQALARRLVDLQEDEFAVLPQFITNAGYRRAKKEN